MVISTGFCLVKQTLLYLQSMAPGAFMVATVIIGLKYRAQYRDLDDENPALYVNHQSFMAHLGERDIPVDFHRILHMIYGPCALP